MVRDRLQAVEQLGLRQLQSPGFTLRNAIVAGNTAPAVPDVSGRLVSLGHNLIGVGEGGVGWTPTDWVGTATARIGPLLEPLGDHGGPTPTRRPQPGSPAVDAGDNNDVAATDQRGLPRVAEGVVDIGAVERQPGE